MSGPAADAGDGLRAPSLVRRLLAMVYDLLLVAALLMTVNGALVLANRGEALYPAPWWLLPFDVLVAFAFFAGFWLRDGQTLGMRAWRLRLVREDGGRPTLADASKRFAAAALSFAPAGLGYLWIVVDDERRAWHDRLSATRMVLEPKPAR